MKPADKKQIKGSSKTKLPSEFLFLSQGQTEARKKIGEAISGETHFVAITGPSGSGKTMLLEQFAQHLGKNVTLARISHYENSSANVLRDVLTAFGQHPGDLGTSKDQDFKELLDFLLYQDSKNKKTVLMVDNAETMDHETLFSFYSLSELRSEGKGLLSIMLAGDIDWALQLSHPESGQSAFPSTPTEITPFTETETYLYLQKSLQIVNPSEQTPVSKRGAKLIHFYSCGNPLAIKKLSDLALQLANLKGKNKLTHQFAMKAVKTAQWVKFSEQFPPVHTRKETSESITSPEGQAKVILFKCNQKVAEHNIGKKLFSLGRAPTNTLTLRRPTVSRRHACLTILNNQVWIKNIGETNSTYVNAKSIKNTPLSDGDIIRVSDFLLLFIYENNDSTRVETIPTTTVLSTEEKSNKPSDPTHQEIHKTSENLDSSETIVEPLLTEFTTQQASNKKSDAARIEAIPATPTLSTKEKNNQPSGATLQNAHKDLENLDNSEIIVEPAPTKFTIKQASNKESDPTGIEATPTTATLSAIENRNKRSDATHQEAHKNQDSLDDSKAAEKPTLNELHTSKQASNTQKNHAISVVERRHRREREHNKRRFVLMAGGVAALFGPMLAVILFFNLAKNESTPTIEVPAKLEKTPIQNHSLSTEAASPPQQQGSIAHNDSATSSPESTMKSNNATDNKQISESVVGDNKLQKLITQARQHIRNDEFSQSLNLIIEGTKLDPNSHELASLQAESIEKLEKKEQEWKKDK